MVSFGLVKQIAVKDGAVSVSMQLTTNHPEVRADQSESERVLKALPGVTRVQVEVNQQGAPQAAAPQSPWAQQQRSGHPADHRGRQRQRAASASRQCR